MKVSLSYGSTELRDVEVDGTTTLGQVLNQFSPALRLPEKFKAYNSRGQEISLDSVISDGESISFEKAACSKA